FYRQNPETRDLYSGILVADEMRSLSTHLDDRFRGSDIWGTWGRAWTCDSCQMLFSITNELDEKTAHVRQLRMGYHPLSRCGCGKEFPKCTFHEHRSRFTGAGFRPLGNDYDEPFEVPGQGGF